MLYSREFLRAARARLGPGGVYAQWFHLYETDAATLALVLATYRDVFPEVGVWLGTGVDLVLLGFADEEARADLSQLEARAQRPDFRAQLAALGLSSLPRLIAHEVLPLGVLREVPLPGRVHTLYHPLLSDLAARAFFRDGSARLPESIARRAAEAGARRSLVAQLRARHGGDLMEAERVDLVRETCRVDATLCATLFAQWQHEAPGAAALGRELAAARRDRRLARVLDPAVLDHLAALYGGDALAGRETSYALATDLRRVFARYYHHAAPFAAESLHEAWRRCASSDRRCQAQLSEVLGLGLPPTLLSRR
jgi:hypothetical protein